MKGPFLQHTARRCLQGLRALQRPEGGFLAAPEGSPYAYVYSRDTAFVCAALDKARLWGESRRALDFLLSVQGRDGHWDQRYTPQGHPSCDRPGQWDCTGLVVSALCRHALATGDDVFGRRAWPAVERAAAFLLDQLSRGLVHVRHSVHESPREEGYEVWANAWCWRGLRDAARLALRLGETSASVDLSDQAERLAARVVHRFWDPSRGHFVKLLGGDLRPATEEPDVTATAPVWAGMVSPRSGLGHDHLEAMARALWDPHVGGFQRFRRDGYIQEWRWFDGGSGSWIFYTAMMASAYLRAGRRQEAERCLRWCAAQFLPDGELPEHVATAEEFELWRRHDPQGEELLAEVVRRAEESAHFLRWEGRFVWVLPWIFPLAWSHAQVLSAVLDYAGSLRMPLHLEDGP